MVCSCGKTIDNTGRPPSGRRVTCSKACLDVARAANRAAWHARQKRDNPRGPAHPLWKGFTMRNGYRSVRPINYPFPESVGANGTIYEHRMIMELHLSRRLVGPEVVHHVNGDKTDNRIENLRVYASNGEHTAGHRYPDRWPMCIFGCGRQSKPYLGNRWHACALCRQKAAHRGDPRTLARD